MLEYMCNCLKEACDNLGGCEEGLLARGALEIPSLFEPSLECAWRTLKLKLLAKDGILNNTMVLRLRAILDNFVYLSVRELKRRTSSIRAHALRVIVS
jgi:hypothetical protein